MNLASPSQPAEPLCLSLPNLKATQELAQRIAHILAAGDVLALRGPLGAGKTTFARDLIRALVDEEIEVPSPTFTLMQTYETPRGTLWHCDLYRIKHPDELTELGWDEARRGILLIEWPEHAGSFLPRARLDLAFTLAAHQKRSVSLQGDPAWHLRLQQAGL